MILPSIDLRDGHSVQLVGGREQALDAGDPRPIARRFGRVGEIAIVDLDAALGTGSNADVVEELLAIAPCRVGGGIRDAATAIRWLDAGARRVVLGTAARRDVLEQLPPDRVVAALDAVDGEVVVDGWRTRTGETVEARLAELRGLVDEFFVTFVEREGRMTGMDLDRVAALREAAGPARLTVAGGIATVDEIASLDRIGVDAQVGMALYSGRFGLADVLAGVMRSDRADGLWPTVVVDENDIALGLAYSSPRSLRRALDEGRGIYESRSRGVWVKGESSGATQELLRIDMDCDRDALRFTVRQAGDGFCHRATRSCFGDARGWPDLVRRTAARADEEDAGSYTKRLLGDRSLLEAKLVEEAGELADARDPEHVAEEAADVLYFTAVALARAGVTFDAVERILDRRALRCTRRSAVEVETREEEIR